jgi:hypothetical protein
LELVTGERGKRFMKSKIKYTSGPIGKIELTKDMLPSPEELIYRDRNEKVTINLKKSSVDFFRAVARNNRSRYQKVIRSVLDSYATAFSHRA